MSDVDTDYRSQITVHTSQITDHTSQITDYRLQFTDYSSHFTDYRLQFTHHASHFTAHKKHPYENSSRFRCLEKGYRFCYIDLQRTADFPKNETYGIISQIRRSAVSVPSNIAEGAARKTLKEFSYFLSISLGSISELETQLIISKILKYINEVSFNELEIMLVDIRKMLIGLKKSLSNRI
jgi:four helix bundle protein